MRIIRCFTPHLELDQSTCLLSQEESIHLCKVLRLKVGDPIEIIDGIGHLASAEIAAIEQIKRSFSVTAKINHVQTIPQPNRHIHLFIAAPKGKLMNQIIKDATELGVWAIHPILCRYSVVDLTEKNPVDAWRLQAVEACKQSGNPFMPQFFPMLKFDEALTQAPPQGFLGAVPDLEKPSSESLPQDGDLALWIGPEGGFSDEEHQQLLTHKYCPITAGQWVLRVETAVTALLGILLQK